MLKDVHTALLYLYKGCTVWLASTLEVSGLWDAVSLARFAHKYEVEPLLQACEEYLVQTLQTMGRDGKDTVCVKARKNIDTLAILIDLAETCSMRKLLAHCELLMITIEDADLWTHPAMLSDAVSRHSLLRMLRAFQAGLNRAGGGSRVRPTIGQLQCFNNLEWQRQEILDQPLPNAQDPRIATLMSWHKP